RQRIPRRCKHSSTPTGPSKPMPNRNQHRVKAENNRRFLNQIDPADNPEWSVVVAFYTAVHLVEQLLAERAGHSKDHQERLEFVQHEHPQIHSDYQQLYNVSRLARYESRQDFFRQFSAEDVREKIIDGWLARIERYVAERLTVKPPSSLQPPSEG